MAAFSLAGCGGGTGIDNGHPDLENFIVPDFSEPPPEPQPDLAKACVFSCAVDSDCQNSCPAASGGVNCCDTTSGQCYIASESICPAPADMAIASSY